MGFTEGSTSESTSESLGGPSFLSQLGGLILLASLLPEEAFRQLGPALFGSTAPELVGAVAQGPGQVELTPQFPNVRDRMRSISGFEGGMPIFSEGDGGGGRRQRTFIPGLGLSPVGAGAGAGGGGEVVAGSGGGGAGAGATPITRDLFSQLYALLSNLSHPLIVSPEDTMALSQRALSQALGTLGGLLG